MLAKISSNFSPASPPRETSSFAQSMSECTRKRKHQAEDDDFDPSNPQSQDEKNKTRRINPFKLAERLPAGLVKEMETFIRPGAIMPNFDIRKELQIRYQVDRRHLYDYFHSRGLRVAREDRHSNLTRSRIAKAKAQVQGNEKENVPLKSARPIKLPPAKRSMPKLEPSRKSSKKPALAPDVAHRFMCQSSSSVTAYNHARDAETISDVDDKTCFETEVDGAQFEFVFANNSPYDDVDVTFDVSATLEELQPCFYSEDAHVISGRSTPSLTNDSSSCKSPSPAPDFVQAEEEPFSAAEFAAEFLNLPEDLEIQDHTADTIFDCSSAPSMIGDLMCPSDRNNMYENIDTNIVSSGTSFALDLSALQVQAEASSLHTAASSSFQLPSSLESYIKALQSMASGAMPAFQTSLPTPMPSYSTSYGYCIPPAALSNATRVFTPSDFLTPGFRQIDNVPFSVPGVPSAVAYSHTNSFYPATQTPLRTVYTGESI